MTIFFKGDMPAQNRSQEPLKFQGGTFDAIKIFREKISPEVLPDVTRKFQCPIVVMKPLGHHGYTHAFR